MSRRFWVALAVWALVTGAVLAWFGRPALGAPVDDLAARSDAWLTRTLHTTIPDRPVVVGGKEEMATCGGTRPAYRPGCVGLASAQRIALDAVTWALVEDTLRGEWGWEDETVTLAHEQGHDGRPLPTRQARMIEEGLVESVTQDVAPAWWRAMFGRRLDVALSPAYPEQVRAVRLASARAAGGSWRSRAARLLRRDWRAADNETRAREIGARLSAAEFQVFERGS